MTAGTSPPPSSATGPEAETGARVTLAVTGMTCAACSARVQRVLGRLPGVQDASVNLMTGEAAVRFDPLVAAPDQLVAAVVSAGYGAELPRPDDGAERMWDEADAAHEAAMRQLRGQLAVSLAAGIVVMLPMVPALEPLVPSWLQLLVTLPVLGWAGRDFFTRGVAAARHGGADMNTLVALGTGSAFLLSLAMTLAPARFHAAGVHPHPYYDSVVWIIALVLLGRRLEERAKRSATGALRRLMHLRPDTALLWEGGAGREVPATSLRPGQAVLVKPGAAVPADGVIVEGRSALDESMLTGEPLPVERGPGDAVTGATINRGAALVVRVVRVGADTLLGRVVRLVRDAQATRPSVQRLADRIAAVFVPVVLGLAVLTFALWAALGPEPRWLQAAISAVTVLVIACPCAMGLAVPTAVMVSTGRAAQLGLLVRGGDVLERGARIDTVVLDKTGTVTEGRPQLVHAALADDALALVAALERRSEHPLAAPIVAGAEARGLALSADVRDVAVRPGEGATGTVAGRAVAVGNAALLAHLGVDAGAHATTAARHAESGATAVYVMVDGAVAGVLGISDPVRPTSAAAVAALRARGVDVVLLTGDTEATARAVAGQVGIGTVCAGVKPEGKLAEVARLQATGRHVAMVGDGINDAPALARADVGIAMGSGTDVAMETAAITLLRPDLGLVGDALALMRRTMRTIRQNLFWAFAYNVVCIPVAAGALYPLWGVRLTPMLAAAAMAVSSVTVVGNSLRLRGRGARRREPGARG
ncbi:MAG: heavy metal translocating P-type ATPase [Gemmatimonadales bacterium]|nr:heavy metal translocating P-type ATPase [Gemmatimonadales bacterium]